MAEYNGQQIPDQDYGALADGWVIQLLNYLGYEWPTTNTSQLDAWADQWAQASSSIQSVIDDIDGAHRYVMANNSGAGADAFDDFMRSDGGPAVALASVGNAAPMISGAYSAVSLLVTGLRVAVIAEILLDAIQIGMAIFTGGLSAAGSLLIKQGAGAAIDFLIDQAINEILGD